MEESATEAGLFLSDWIRMRAVDAMPQLRKPSPDREVLLRLLAALGKIGSNLNQVSRQLNRKQDSPEFILPLETILYAVEGFRTIVNQLRKTLDNAGH